MLIVDKIENRTALCEDMDNGEKKELDLNLLPPEVKEGDILFADSGRWIIDKILTSQRKAELSERLYRLFKKQ